MGGLALSGIRQQFTIPSSFDSGAHLALELSQDQVLTLRASGSAIPLLSNRAMSQVDHGDGTHTFEFIIGDIEEFLFEILTQTTDFEVVAPIEFRERAIALLGEQGGA